MIVCHYSCVSGQNENSKEEETKQTLTLESSIEYLSELEEAIVGKWENVSMIVKVHSFENSDTSFIVHITEDNWETKMNIKPIVTTIHPDGRYRSEYRNSFDSLIYAPIGTWMIDGDTLIMEDHQDIYKYQIFVNDDEAEFRNMVDWDKDGLADDEYFGIQRKNK